MDIELGSGGTAVGVALRVTPGFPIPLKYQNPGWLEEVGSETPPTTNGFLQNYCTMNYSFGTAIVYDTVVAATPMVANVPVNLNNNPAYNASATTYVYTAENGTSYTTRKLAWYCALTIACTGLGAGSVITIHGFDIYKNKITEQVTWSGENYSLQQTKNAFAMVYQVISNTNGNAITVGLSNTLGMYYRTPSASFLNYIKCDDTTNGTNTLLTGTNLITPAFDGTPTATTGDVRGLINLPIYVEPGRRLVVSQNLEGMYPPMFLQTIDRVFGQMPYAAF
jgi:hypothetical protein